MPNELPYMPTFIRDFLAAVAGWPPDRVGAYWLALMYQWENGGLPANDERELARILHTSRHVARRLWAEIAPKFQLGEGDRYWNLKCEKVRKNSSKIFTRASEASRQRWNKNGDHAAADTLLAYATKPKPKYVPSSKVPRGNHTKKQEQETAHIQRSREVKRLMAEEGLSVWAAAKRAGYQ